MKTYQKPDDKIDIRYPDYGFVPEEQPPDLYQRRRFPEEPLQPRFIRYENPKTRF